VRVGGGGGQYLETEVGTFLRTRETLRWGSHSSCLGELRLDRQLTDVTAGDEIITGRVSRLPSSA
jgi:hypothetical protein